MKKTIGLVVAMAMAGALSAPPASALFGGYEEPTPPRAGDCSAADAAWYGEVAGNRYDEFLERRYPFSDRGCFASEFDCEAFLNQAMTWSGRGGIVYARCRPGAPS